MLLQERVRTEKFSDSQKAVIDYIFTHTAQIRTMTIRQIAQASYTSNATLIRIAHKLGYEGWEAFKDAFLKEQDYLSSHFQDLDANLPFAKTDSTRTICSKVVELKKEALADTASLLAEKDLEAVCQILESASHIYILASNNTRILGQLFALKLGRIDKKVLVPEVHGEIKYTTWLQEKGAAVIAISYSGETDTILSLARKAAQAKTPLIAITSIGDNSLTGLADISLRICTREKMYSKISWYTTEEAISCLLDLLYSLLFSMHYEQNLERKINTARALENKRNSTSSIIQEQKSTPST